MEEVNQVRRIWSDQKLRPIFAKNPWLAKPEVFFSQDGQALAADAVYEVRVMHKAGAILFTANVPDYVRDFTMKIVHELGLDDGRPFVVHCGDEELPGDFQRICDGQMCIVMGTTGKFKFIRRLTLLEGLVVYSRLIKDSDLFPYVLGANRQPAPDFAAQSVKLVNAILHIVTHELLHAKYLQHSEAEVHRMTMDVLAGHTEIVSMPWTDFSTRPWVLMDEGGTVDSIAGD